MLPCLYILSEPHLLPLGSLSPWTVAVASKADSSWKDWRALELQPWSTWGCSWGLTSHKMRCLISITMGIKKRWQSQPSLRLVGPWNIWKNQWQVEKRVKNLGSNVGLWWFMASEISQGPGGISDFRIPLVIQCLSAQARCMEFHVPRDTPVDVLRLWLKMFSLIYWF